MAIQYPGFNRLETPDYSGFSDFFSNILKAKGQKQALERGGYENQIKAEEARLAPESMQAKLAQALLHNRQTEQGIRHGEELHPYRLQNEQFKAQQAPFSGLTGDIRNALMVRQLEDRFGPDHPYVQEAKAQLDLERRNKESAIQQRQTIDKLRGFNSLPVDDKANVLAGWRAMGIPEAQALNNIANGKTLEEAGREIGLTEEEAANLGKKFAPTGAIRTDIAEVKGAAAEEAFLGKKISEGIAPYAQQYFGVSPEQIMDAFKDDDLSVDKQAKFLAAKALEPEKALLQIKMASGSNAYKAIHDVMERSLSSPWASQAQVTPKVYKKMQEYLHDWLQEAVQIRTDSMSGIERSPKKLSAAVKKAEQKAAAPLGFIDISEYEYE